MSNKYRIYFWHGKHEGLAKELSAFCEADSAGDLFYVGSLDDFADKYPGQFIVRKQSEEGYDDLICVTQYSSFGQR